MSEETRSVALERRPIQVPVALISDDEVRRLYRVAESLALSKMFKDVSSAEQAFAKMIVGRDLGMSPAQSLLGLHLVEGNVMVHYSMLGRFIKAREDDGYDYRAGWIKRGVFATVHNHDADAEPRVGVIVGEEQDPNVGRVWVVRFRSGNMARLTDSEVSIEQRDEFVWMDEDDPTDVRPIVGASVTFTVKGRTVGVSTFTLDDAKTAGLIKERGGWKSAPRNMLLARAMSNGVKWYVPEVMGGLPIYAEGEIVEEQSVTAPVGGGSDEGAGLDLGPKVEKIIARATELGHAGLSNRAALEVALGDRSQSVINDWIGRANAELDRFAAAKVAEPEPEDAVVVEDKPLTATQPLAEQVQEDRVVQDMQTQVLQTRLRQLEEARREEQDPEQRALIDEEIEHVQHKLGADEEVSGNE